MIVVFYLLKLRFVVFDGASTRHNRTHATRSTDWGSKFFLDVFLVLFNFFLIFSCCILFLIIAMFTRIWVNLNFLLHRTHGWPLLFYLELLLLFFLPLIHRVFILYCALNGLSHFGYVDFSRSIGTKDFQFLERIGILPNFFSIILIYFFEWVSFARDPLCREFSFVYRG